MIHLLADKIKVNGPKVDGNYSITLDCGEYNQSQIASILNLPQNTTLQISVEVAGGNDQDPTIDLGSLLPS